jgi:hypothetical protein
MGNALRCFGGEDDHHGGGGHYPYYQPQYYSHDPTAAVPRPHQQALGRHGVSPATVGGGALRQVRIHVHGNRVLAVAYGVLHFLPPFVFLLCMRLFSHCRQPSLSGRGVWAYKSPGLV